jgi:hypothetical protein
MVLVALAVTLEDGWVDVNLLGNVCDDTLGNLGHVGERTARKPEQVEVDGENQTIGGSTMTADDVESTSGFETGS